MQNLEEIITVQRIGKEFVNPTDSLEIQIPGLTNGLVQLDVKELKIGIDASGVGSDTSWIYLEIKSPNGGLIPAAGTQIATVPALDGGGTTLYRQYHHDNLILLKLNTKQATCSSRPIHLRILTATKDPLPITYLYLRMNLTETRELDPYLVPLSVSRFQAL